MVCSKRNCNKEVYQEHKHCLLHCPKDNFNQNNITDFWNTIRNTYNFSENKDITIENIFFPTFQQFYYPHAHNFFQNYSQNFQANITFINCYFHDSFNLPESSTSYTISFKNCIFKQSLQFKSVEKLIIDNCEFKSGISQYTIHNLEIRNTKFIKPANFYCNQIAYLENITCRNNFKIQGGNSLDLYIKESEFNKQLITSQVDVLKYENIVIKSNIIFENHHNKIFFSNLEFKKNIQFHNFNSLELLNINCQNNLLFAKDLTQKEILIKECEIKSIFIDNLESLKIINSTVKENLDIRNISSLLSIENSTFEQNIQTSNIEKIYIQKNSKFNNFIQEMNCNDFSIKNSTLSELQLNTFDTLNIEDSEIKTINCKNNQSQHLVIKNTSILNLTLSELKSILLEKIISYPKILIQSKSNDIIIKNSRLSLLEAQEIKSLNISQTIIKHLKLLESCTDLVFKNVRIKNKTVFPDLNNIKLESCRIFKLMELGQTTEFYSKNTTFDDSIIMRENINSSKFEDSKVNGQLIGFELDTLDLKNSIFENKLIFKKAVIKLLNITNSYFKEELDFDSAQLESILISSDKKELICYNIFEKNLTFSHSKINNISLENSIFNGQVIFNHLQNTFIFNNIKDTSFNDTLLINNVITEDLFIKSTNLIINNLSISYTSIGSKQSLMQKMDKGSLTFKDIIVKHLTLKEVNFKQTINFENLTIDYFTFLNSNIDNIFRIKNCFIKNIASRDNIFEDFQIIDNKYTRHKSEQRNLTFSNTTIKNAVFDKLKYDNFIMNDAHVSEAKIGYVKFDNASRETNRFFKNYYDSISDYITANDYYSREMEEQMKSCKKINSSEWWILQANRWISRFGQNWWLPLIWIIAFTLIFYRIANHDLLSLEGFRENHISWMMNDILKFSNPFTKKTAADYGNLYWAWLVHKLTLSALIYHFIIAIKRKTRR